MVSYIGLNGGRGHFIYFLGAPMILLFKSVFLAVNASFRWLNNVNGVYMYLVQVSLLLIVQQGLGHFFR